jgi:hypothetical protein
MNVSIDTLLLRICRLHDRVIFNHTDVLALNAASIALTCTGQTHLFCGVLFLCSRSVTTLNPRINFINLQYNFCTTVLRNKYPEVLFRHSSLWPSLEYTVFLLNCMHLLEHRVSPYVQFSVLVNGVLLFENSNFQWYIEVECLWNSQQMLGQI